MLNKTEMLGAAKAAMKRETFKYFAGQLLVGATERIQKKYIKGTHSSFRNVVMDDIARRIDIASIAAELFEKEADEAFGSVSDMIINGVVEGGEV